jgi:hypothetical protein
MGASAEPGAGDGARTPWGIGVTAPLEPTSAPGAVVVTGLEARAAVGGEGAALGVGTAGAVADAVRFGATVGAAIVAVGA